MEPAYERYLNIGLNNRSLTLHLDRSVVFNKDSTADEELVIRCTTDVIRTLCALRQIDKNVIRGFSVGTAAYVLSYLLPFNTIAIAGIGYGCWYLHARQTAAMEYAQALENLISCYTWTLGRKQAANIEDAVCINEMIKALAPLTTNKQLLKLAHTEYHDAISPKANAMRRQTVIDGHRLNKEELDLCYGLYGYQQGGFFAVLQVISYLFRYSYSALSKVMPWYKKTVDASEDEAVGTPAMSMST